MQHPLAISFAMLLAAGIGSAVCAQEVAAGAEADQPRRVVFTEAEMARFRQIAAEMNAKRESYIRASEDDEIIELEPYVVESDGSLALARLRRDLEQGYRPRPFAPAAADRAAMLIARRANDEFFGYGGPRAVLNSEQRAGGSMLYVNPLALIATFRERKFSNIFAAPRE